MIFYCYERWHGRIFPSRRTFVIVATNIERSWPLCRNVARKKCKVENTSRVRIRDTILVVKCYVIYRVSALMANREFNIFRSPTTFHWKGYVTLLAVSLWEPLDAPQGDWCIGGGQMSYGDSPSAPSACCTFGQCVRIFAHLHLRRASRRGNQPQIYWQ